VHKRRGVSERFYVTSCMNISTLLGCLGSSYNSLPYAITQQGHLLPLIEVHSLEVYCSAYRLPEKCLSHGVARSISACNVLWPCACARSQQVTCCWPFARMVCWRSRDGAPLNATKLLLLINQPELTLTTTLTLTDTVTVIFSTRISFTPIKRCCIYERNFFTRLLM